VVLCLQGAVASVEVRGSAPGTRETDLLNPVNLVEQVQAVVLSGGSVHGLAAADGVVQWLAERGLGFELGGGQVAPIVPGASLYDLGRGVSFVPPIGPDWGAAACGAARDDESAQGSVGAGAGAMSGGIKGGWGMASLVLDSGLTVAAGAAVNSLGTVLDPATGLPWEARLLLEGEGPAPNLRPVRLPQPPPPQAGRNTTIGVVATDAVLNKTQCLKLAMMAHDGLARAIRPAHTMFDGDTIFCLATGKRPLPSTPGFFAAPQAQAINDLGQAMADCFARAAIKAVLAAASLGEMKAWQDMPGLHDQTPPTK
jgi:L-aminopeptidase/D-esterase-like protein